MRGAYSCVVKEKAANFYIVATRFKWFPTYLNPIFSMLRWTFAKDEGLGGKAQLGILLRSLAYDGNEVGRYGLMHLTILPYYTRMFFWQ